MQKKTNTHLQFYTFLYYFNSNQYLRIRIRLQGFANSNPDPTLTEKIANCKLNLTLKTFKETTIIKTFLKKTRLLAPIFLR